MLFLDLLSHTVYRLSPRPRLIHAMQGTNNLGGSGTSVPSTPTAKSPIFALPGAGAAPSPSESYELPAGWRKAISAKGKPYFLNDQARESSW